MLYFEKSLFWKVWHGFVGAVFILNIAVFLYQLINDYISNVLGLGVMFCGFILLFISKMHLFKKGHFFSFGTALMSRKMGYLYIFAYLLLTLGLLIVFLNAEIY